jgi:dipeptidyl aminopeptidase/acylaminoacyl peptidase
MVSPVRQGTVRLARLGIPIGYALSAGLAGAAPVPGRAWSFEDIATVPEVTDIKLAPDRSHALYSVLVADIGRDRNRAELRRINLSDGSQTVLLTANSIKRLQRIPGSPDWSALIDRGEGQQLYRIGPGGNIEPLLVNARTVMVGTADQAIPSLEVHAPIAVGIASYDWSPDGQWLWYSQLRTTTEREPVLYDVDVTRQRDQIRKPVRAEVDFYLRNAKGEDRLITSRPVTDFLAYRYGGRARWDGDHLRYRTATPDDHGGYAFQSYAWSLKDQLLRQDDEQKADDATFAIWGVRGGRLASEGVGWQRSIVETLGDGTRIHYGKTDFAVGDMRSAGSFRSSDGRFVIVGTRDNIMMTYGLAIVDHQKIRPLATNGSFTQCDFDANLLLGVCVRQTLTWAPDIVVIRPKRGSVTRIGPVSEAHDQLRKLHVQARSWKNRLGYTAKGFVVLPSGYDPSKRYPTIFVTHGSDADQRFAAPEFQWNYPVQMLAQAGYLVILINDPYPYQEPKIAAALRQQLTGTRDIAPAELQRLWWLNSVYSIEDAAREMAADGLVDINHVGVAGYSRGSQIANVAMTQSTLFKAASSGDGSH